MRTIVVAKTPLEEDPRVADRATVDLTEPATSSSKETATQPPAPDLTVSVANVSKNFGQVQALDRLNIEVPRSTITVLLGPNGAGKTTAIRMITGALSPDSGSVSVFGSTPDGANGESIRRRCGVVSAKPSLYDRLSGWDNLRYAAELYDLGRGADTDDRIGEAAARFGIHDALDQRVGGYSTGMKTRLALARAIVHRPQLLLLDEPTSGLDPESALEVLALVRQMTADGQTVLMCTHLLLEAEGLADEIVVIQDGTTLLSGRPVELAKRYWPTPQVTISTRRQAELDGLEDLEGVARLNRQANSATVTFAGEDRTAEVVGQLARSGAAITSVVPYEPSLEDLYLAIRRDRRLDRHLQLDAPQKLESAGDTPDRAHKVEAHETTT